ncbi:hypothetical protein fHeYen801_090 [Yersinia phage fHe-Yen8-01]|nr:hypothetical protein fHeYen801_090 [Yersinia phage fHe-Yen8-01]
MSTIDDVVIVGPLGIGPVAAVCIQPKYIAGMHLPDRTDTDKFPKATMAPAVSFVFPEPKVHDTKMAIPS